MNYRAEGAVLAAMENAYNERDKTKSSNWLEELIRNLPA